MARDRGRDRSAVPRRLPGRVAALAAALAVGAALYGLQSAGALAPHSDPAWTWALPGGMPQPRVPAANPMSRGKVAIGHRLFYDARLSGNGTQSCATCHRPQLAFTDGRATPVGSTGESLPRNSPSIVNSAYRSTLTWANPALVTLEKQMEVPLFATHPVELGVNDKNKGEVLGRIRRDGWYAKRFPQVFRTARRPISWTNVIRSIAAFERSIVSAGSKYDRYLRGTATLSTPERRGMDLFMGEEAECHHCHGSFLFDDQDTYVGSPVEPLKFHNTGIYNVGETGEYPYPNRGLFEITGRAKDMGAFRAPSLRNVARTAPYMHDGSVATLKEVVDNYAAGGRVIAAGPYAGDGRRNPHKDPLIRQIDLSEEDRADIVAFLLTLTEPDFSQDPRFADPFKRKR
ncbi:MAG: di-heme enzyme [Actinobacteria bacterium]|nr:di-heme enzyme [Actinomycetota bacterium]